MLLIAIVRLVLAAAGLSAAIARGLRPAARGVGAQTRGPDLRRARRRRARLRGGAMTHDVIVLLAVLGVVGQVLFVILLAIGLLGLFGIGGPLTQLRLWLEGYELW